MPEKKAEAESQDAAGFSPRLNPGLNADLLELSRRLLSSLDQDEIVLLTNRYAKALLDLDIVTISLIKETMQIIGMVSEDQARIISSEIMQHIKEGKGISGRAYTSGEIATTADYWNDLSIEHTPELDKVMRDLRIIALLNVPVRLGDGSVALLGCGKYQAHRWEERELFLSQEIAYMAGMAFNNAYLYRTLQQLHREVTARNYELENLQQLTRQNDQLNGVLALARTAAHELNQPLTVLQMELDIAIELGEITSERAVQAMQDCIKQMADRIRQYQKITRFETVETLPGLPITDLKKAAAKKDEE